MNGMEMAVAVGKLVETSKAQAAQIAELTSRLEAAEEAIVNLQKTGGTVSTSETPSG